MRMNNFIPILAKKEADLRYLLAHKFKVETKIDKLEKEIKLLKKKLR